MDQTDAIMKMLEMYRQSTLRRAKNTLRQRLQSMLIFLAFITIALLGLGIYEEDWRVIAGCSVPVIIGVGFVLLYTHDVNHMCGGIS